MLVLVFDRRTLKAIEHRQLGDSLRAPAFVEHAGPGYDRVLCDPPVGAPLRGEGSFQLRKPFTGLELTRSESLFVALSASALAPEGRAVIALPTSFLSRKGGDTRTHRQEHRCLPTRCRVGLP